MEAKTDSMVVSNPHAPKVKLTGRQKWVIAGLICLQIPSGALMAIWRNRATGQYRDNSAVDRLTPPARVSACSRGNRTCRRGRRAVTLQRSGEPMRIARVSDKLGS